MNAWLLRSLGLGLVVLIAARGVAQPAAAQMFVVEPVNNRIVRIDDMSGRGSTTFGTLGRGVNQFIGPSGVFVK